jgi:hypothetical protein
MKIYNAAQMYIGTGVEVCVLLAASSLSAPQ